MLYYKRLENINWKPVQEKVLNYINNFSHLYLKQNLFYLKTDTQHVIDHVPEIVELFRSMNLTIKQISFVVLYQQKLNIHIDNTDEVARINIPILNCNGTETRFYRARKTPTLLFKHNNVSYYPLTEENCDLVDVVEIDVPTIIRIKEPHGVFVNHDKYPRITCIVSFFEKVENLLEEK